MLFGNKWKATPMHLRTEFLHSVMKQCHNFSTESNAIPATLLSARPQIPKPLNQRHSGTAKGGRAMSPSRAAFIRMAFRLPSLLLISSYFMIHLWICKMEQTIPHALLIRTEQ